MHCTGEQVQGKACHVPGSCLNITPTIAVGEGVALMACLANCLQLQSEDRKMLYVGDADFWANWALDLHLWLRRLHSAGPGKFGNIKLINATLILLLVCSKGRQLYLLGPERHFFSVAHCATACVKVEGIQNSVPERHKKVVLGLEGGEEDRTREDLSAQRFLRQLRERWQLQHTHADISPHAHAA